MSGRPQRVRAAVVVGVAAMCVASAVWYLVRSPAGRAESHVWVRVPTRERPEFDPGVWSAPDGRRFRDLRFAGVWIDGDRGGGWHLARIESEPFTQWWERLAWWRERPRGDWTSRVYERVAIPEAPDDGWVQLAQDGYHPWPLLHRWW